jgi:hypothetical protein
MNNNNNGSHHPTEMMKQFQRPSFNNQISMISNNSATPTPQNPNEKDEDKNGRPS